MPAAIITAAKVIGIILGAALLVLLGPTKPKHPVPPAPGRIIIIDGAKKAPLPQTQPVPPSP